MSLEGRVKSLEDKYDALDHAFRENNKILEATHGVVSLILNEQREQYKDLKKEMAASSEHLEKEIAALNARLDKQDKRSDKIEETLIQIVNLLSK